MTDGPDPATAAPERLSVVLGRWLSGDDRTLGGLIDLFGPRSFAVVFVVLMAVPALPLPTGGATHVFEILVALGALQLIIGHDEIWVPARWRTLAVGGGGPDSRFFRVFLGIIRGLERISRPRGVRLLRHRGATIAFGIVTLIGTVAAFVAPPFTGLDTLPSVGVVVLSLGFLLEDVVIVAGGVVVVAAGILVEVLLAKLAIGAATSLL